MKRFLSYKKLFFTILLSILLLVFLCLACSYPYLYQLAEDGYLALITEEYIPYVAAFGMIGFSFFGYFLFIVFFIVVLGQFIASELFDYLLVLLKKKLEKSGDK